jgi:hypothetical protein
MKVVLILLVLLIIGGIFAASHQPSYSPLINQQVTCTQTYPSVTCTTIP